MNIHAWEQDAERTRGEQLVRHDVWVIVDGDQYAEKEAFTTHRARRVLAVLKPSDLPALFLVVGDDQRFHTVYARDCQWYQIEDDKAIFIDLD